MDAASFVALQRRKSRMLARGSKKMEMRFTGQERAKERLTKKATRFAIPGQRTAGSPTRSDSDGRGRNSPCKLCGPGTNRKSTCSVQDPRSIGEWTRDAA